MIFRRSPCALTNGQSLNTKPTVESWDSLRVMAVRSYWSSLWILNAVILMEMCFISIPDSRFALFLSTHNYASELMQLHLRVSALCRNKLFFIVRSCKFRLNGSHIWRYPSTYPALAGGDANDRKVRENYRSSKSHINILAQLGVRSILRAFKCFLLKKQ